MANPELVITDILDGTSGKLNRIRGWSFDRKFVATGVTGSKHEKIVKAYAMEGMPQIGDPHPAQPSAILEDFSGVSIDADGSVSGILQYRTPDRTVPTDDDVVITGSTTLSQVDTNVAFDGTILTTQYTYPTDYKELETLRGVTVDQPAIVSKLIPQPTETFTLIESDNPRVKSSIYVGKLNSETFLDGNAKTWMCTGIRWNSQNGGVTYQVSYDFQWRPDGWDEVIVFIDPQTAHPPIMSDATAKALGIKTYQIYQTIDLNGLDLT